jgi:uncharacterized protein (TIGR03066 family)
VFEGDAVQVMKKRIHQDRRSPHAASASDTPSDPRKRRVWLVALICLVGATVASFFVFKYLLLPGIPPELVGTWQVTDGPLRGATLEFRRNGTAVAVMYKEGKKETTNQSVRVEGTTMVLTGQDDPSGKNDIVTQTIVRLTDDELVIRDADRNTYRMKRIGD